MRYLDNWQEKAPIAAIFIFAMGSVHSLVQLFSAWARHDNPWLFWPIAVFVEAATAFFVWRIVEYVRIVTKSNQKAEQRKFYGLLAIVLAVLALPSLATSVWANYIEFQGNPTLAILFPSLAVASAVVSAVPEAVRKFEVQKRQESEAKAKKAAATRKAKERTRQEEEASRQRLAEVQQKEVLLTQALGINRQMLAVLRHYAENPAATQGEVAATIGRSRRTVGNYLDLLEEKGHVVRDRDNGGHVEVLVDLPK